MRFAEALRCSDRYFVAAEGGLDEGRCFVLPRKSCLQVSYSETSRFHSSKEHPAHSQAKRAQQGVRGYLGG